MVKKGRVLVTGASGRMGLHLTKKLTGMGLSVRGLVQPSTPSEKKIRLKNFGVELAEGDVNDRPSLVKACADCQTVFHLAAVLDYFQPSNVFERINKLGTENVLQACVETGVNRLVNSSSISVIGRPQYLPVDEKHPCAPIGVYGKTKLEGEILCRRFQELYGLETVIIRPALVYGKGFSLGFDVYLKQVRSGFVPMIDGGNHFIHLVHVDDVVNGFVMAANSPGANGETFFIAGNKAVTFRELTQMVADALGYRPIFVSVPYLAAIAFGGLEESKKLIGLKPAFLRSHVREFAVDYKFSNDKAKKVFGYSPKVNVDTDFPEYITWLNSVTQK